jgi:hypothetical protein
MPPLRRMPQRTLEICYSIKIAGKFRAHELPNGPDYDFRVCFRFFSRDGILQCDVM